MTSEAPGERFWTPGEIDYLVEGVLERAESNEHTMHPFMRLSPTTWASACIRCHAVAWITIPTRRTGGILWGSEALEGRCPHE
jgi:hypothetical protein